MTYNMNSDTNSKTQGSFTGRGIGVDDNDVNILVLDAEFEPEKLLPRPFTR